MRITKSPSNYLNGGFEGNVPDFFQSKDIDCNGYLNYVTGLNQKPMYLNLHFACIVGVGGNSSRSFKASTATIALNFDVNFLRLCFILFIGYKSSY